MLRAPINTTVSRSVIMDMSNFFKFKLKSCCLAIFFLLFIVFYYLNHKYHKFDSFKNYILIITALSTLTLAIGVLFQVLTYRISEDVDIVQSFSAFSTDYFDSIIEIFFFSFLYIGIILRFLISNFKLFE